MEKLVTLAIPVLLAILLIRVMLIPLRAGFRLGIHSGCGFLCLWLLNSISCFTGIGFPINAVTVLTAGFAGLPGIGLMALLAVMGG